MGVSTPASVSPLLHASNKLTARHIASCRNAAMCRSAILQLNPANHLVPLISQSDYQRRLQRKNKE